MRLLAREAVKRPISLHVPFRCLPAPPWAAEAHNARPQAWGNLSPPGSFLKCTFQREHDAGFGRLGSEGRMFLGP